MKILTIEDDEGICTLLKRLLKDADINWTDFRCIGTLEAGIKELETFSPDLIFLDLRLPDSQSGQESVDSIPFLNQFSPVIVLTGAAQLFFIQCLKNGAIDCLDKKLYTLPSNMAFLAQVIARAKVVWRKP